MSRKEDDRRDPELKEIVAEYERLSGDTGFHLYTSYPVETGSGRYQFQGNERVEIGVAEAIIYAQQALAHAKAHGTPYRPFG
jgi:hypothetical protein